MIKAFRIKMYFFYHLSAIEKVETISDLKSLKISSFDHRYKTATKPYIGKTFMFIRLDLQIIIGNFFNL